MKKLWLVLLALLLLGAAAMAGWFLTRPAFNDGYDYERPPLLPEERVSEEKESTPEVQPAADEKNVVVQSSSSKAAEESSSTHSGSASFGKNEYNLWSPNSVTLSGTAENQTELRLNIVRVSTQGISTRIRTYPVAVQENQWEKDVPYSENGSAFALGRYTIELVSVSGTVLATSSLMVPLVD